ncbi:hypothetical protein BsWGS_08038 [Bradybaena similaris]
MAVGLGTNQISIWSWASDQKITIERQLGVNRWVASNQGVSGEVVPGRHTSVQQSLKMIFFNDSGSRFTQPHEYQDVFWKIQAALVILIIPLSQSRSVCPNREVAA